MRILYLIDFYHGLSAETERQLLTLIHHLDRAKFEPELMVLRAAPYLADFVRRKIPLGFSSFTLQQKPC